MNVEIQSRRIEIDAIDRRPGGLLQHDRRPPTGSAVERLFTGVVRESRSLQGETLAHLRRPVAGGRR